MRLLDVICTGDRNQLFWFVSWGSMGLMKKSHLRGWKTPKLRACCPKHAERWVRQKPVQLDLFEGSWFYHERELLYVLPEKEDESSSQST